MTFVATLSATLRSRRAALWLQRAAACAVGLWVIASVFRVFNDDFLHRGAGYDEEFFAWGGWCITKGLAPYKDFIEFKPPLLFITHAFAQMLFGFAHFGYRRFFVLFPLASLFALHVSLTLRRVDAVLSAALVVALTYHWVHPAFHDTALSDSESVGLSYFLLGLAFLLAETPWRAVTDVLGGFFMACAALSKEPYAPTVVTAWLSVYCLRDRLQLSSGWRYLKITGLGVALLVLALCVYMVPTGAMRAYLQMAGNYSRMYQDPKNSYCAMLGVYHPSTPLVELSTQWDGLRAHFLNLNMLGFFAPFFAAAFVFIPRRSLVLLAATASCIVAAMWAPTAARCGWPHYYTMCNAGMIAFLAIGLDTMKGYFWASDRWMRTFVRLAVVGTVAATVYPRYETELPILHPDPTPHEPVPGIFEYIATHTAPSDRIVTTGPPLLYAYTNRIGAIRESTIIDEVLGGYAGNTDEEKLAPIRAELERNMPKLVFLDPEHGDRKRRHLAALINPFLEAHHYRRESEYVYMRP
jgi:hypothetical protein